MRKQKLLKLIGELNRREDEIPNGWYSRKDIEKILNLGRNAVCEFLSRTRERNPDKFLMKKFRVVKRDGSVNRTPYYKIDL